ncbi:MAG: DUF7281 domain-containing protein [Desulfobulbia bacterium]
MAVNALAAKLERLLARGEIAASQFTARDRDHLLGLFDAKVLEEKRSGAGKSVVVKNHNTLAAFVTRHYPSGLEGRQDDLSPRSKAVANFRDSKKSSEPAGAFTVLLRGFQGCELHVNGQPLSVAKWTELVGVAISRLDVNQKWKFSGVLAIVENLEVFWNFEKLKTGAQLAIFSGGRLDERIIKWLSSSGMAQAQIIHCGDYDPVGLDEYLRLKTACPGRTSLHVPPALEEILSRYGNKEIVSRSTAILKRLRKSDDPHVQWVVSLLDRYGVGLEHEALLL